jgi:penicillin-insensitive murein DD-endopeptidase
VAAAVAALVGLGACAELGSIDDGLSLSRGACNHGTIVHSVALPRTGDGYWMPPTWAARGHRWGTDRLVDLVVGVARRVEAPGAPRLAVADLSARRGGRTPQHRSHQAGRDVDLLYFVTDAAGAPVANDAMRPFGADGWTADPHDGAPRLRFDAARNWALIRALITAPEAHVQFIFLYEPLSEQVLDYARAHGASEPVLARARAVLHQPSDSARHDDHMHVRIYCSAADRAAGCVDHGPGADETGVNDVPLALERADLEAAAGALRSAPEVLAGR